MYIYRYNITTNNNKDDNNNDDNKDNVNTLINDKTNSNNCLAG